MLLLSALTGSLETGQHGPKRARVPEEWSTSRVVDNVDASFTPADRRCPFQPHLPPHRGVERLGLPAPLVRLPYSTVFHSLLFLFLPCFQITALFPDYHAKGR
ncbi:hypothetical protein LINPERHAP1_LOCUS35297 [Linum perenne]